MTRFILFLILNFGALAIGGLSTGSGVSSDWYTTLNQAPWTPPGWVFGAAWSFIMVCYTFYMWILYKKSNHKKEILTLFTLQWLLNVFWNPLFFNLHFVSIGLITIISLTIVVTIFLFRYSSIMKLNSLLIIPYFLWLIIATSLNLYICLFN